MLALVRSYYELLLMRLPPQAFPASAALFLIALAAFFVVAFLHHWIFAATHLALARAALSVANICAGSAIILFMARRSPRWLQTATALLGGAALLGLMLLPVTAVWMIGMRNIFVSLSLLAFGIWELVFFAHVYRNALDTGMGAGLAVALIYLLCSMYIKQVFVPLPVGAS